MARVVGEENNKKGGKYGNVSQARKTVPIDDVLAGFDGAMPRLIGEMGGSDADKELTAIMSLLAKAEKERNGRGKRRFVKGYREVDRGIRSNKVRLVLLGDNVEESDGGLETRIISIVGGCGEKNVPVFRGWSRRQVGKRIGKSVKLGAVGVEDFQGAEREWKVTCCGPREATS